MSDNDEQNGQDVLPMPKALSQGDDPSSLEIAALIKTFTEQGTNSLENDDGWNDFKAALWDSLTTGSDDESFINYNGAVAKFHEASSIQASPQINTRSKIYDGPEHANLSVESASGRADSDTASNFVDFSAKQSYLSDLLRKLSKNEMGLLDDGESHTTRVQFCGKEYILSNGPEENVNPLQDQVLINVSEFESRGHNEDAPPTMAEETETRQAIFKVWDLDIPDEEDELSRQLKALVESSTSLSTQNQSANSIEEILYASVLKADKDSSVGTLPSSDDLSTTLKETNLDELIQGITDLSLEYSK